MGLFSKPEVIILKDSNDAKTYLDKLKTLQPSAFGDLQDQIQKEIAITQAGIAGEENILFELKHSNMDMVILHDIYIETQDGLGAQIDFIVVTSKIIFLYRMQKSCRKYRNRFQWCFHAHNHIWSRQTKRRYLFPYYAKPTPFGGFKRSKNRKF